MTWGWPAAFWLLLLLVPLAGLFFYRRRAVVAVVPSILLWDPHLCLVSGNPFGKKLRRLFTFAVQALILLGLILALADPKSPRRTEEDLVLIIDCSATMQTHESSGETRLQQAIAVARSVIDNAPADSTFTLIGAASFPQVLLRSEVDKARARTALTEIAPADVDADLDEAARFACSLKTGPRPLRVVCISDFCAIDSKHLWRRPGPANPEVVLRQVGSARPNLGVVDLRAAPDQQRLTVLIGQHGFFGRDATVRLLSGEREVAAVSQRLEASTAEVQLPAPVQNGETFSVRVEPSDALKLDNTAWGVWPRRDRIKVRLVSQGNLFVEQALYAQPGVAVEQVSSEQWVHDPGADITVLDSPNASGLQDFAGLFIVMNPQPAGTTVPTTLHDEVEVTSWVADHPILRNADPAGWGSIRGTIAPAWPQSRVLASAQERPVLYEWGAATSSAPSSVSRARAIVFNFDLQLADLPLKPAFPVLLWDAIDYLLRRDRADSDIALPTGTTIMMAKSGHDLSTIVDPKGVSHTMLPSGDRVVWQQTEPQGVYRLGQNGEERRVAMNWMSMRSTAAWRAIKAPESLHEPAAMWGRGPWSWRELVTAVALIAVVEWLLFHTRILRID